MTPTKKRTPVIRRLGMKILAHMALHDHPINADVLAVEVHVDPQVVRRVMYKAIAAGLVNDVVLEHKIALKLTLLGHERVAIFNLPDALPVETANMVKQAMRTVPRFVFDLARFQTGTAA